MAVIKVPFAALSKPPVVHHGEVAKPMAAAALVMSAAGQHVDNPEIKNMMTEGALHLYENIEKRDALDSALSMLFCSITSASLDCLAQAANSDPKHLQIRNLNLRHGMKGAAVTIELAKALDSRRGAKSEKVRSVTSISPLADKRSWEISRPQHSQALRQRRPAKTAGWLDHKCPARIPAIGGQCSAPTLRSENAQRRKLQGSCRHRKETLPHAWRGKRFRCSSGQQ